MKKNKEKISNGLIAASLVFAAAGATVSIIVSRVVPSFGETFDSFGTDLPLITNLVVSAKDVYPWMAVVGIIVAVSKIPIRLKSVFILSCVVSGFLMLLLPIAMLALYLPVFTMGNV